ncbi:MAG: carboxypeptidase regulatory-like domain-containing protein [Bacteroidota bacterium]
MKSSLLIFLITTIICVGSLSGALAQGTTTANMRGQILDESGEGLPGATVQAVHTPTGSTWGNVTDVNGYFRLSALNVGGPYTVTVSFVGYDTQEKNNIYLQLGQTYNLNVEISEASTELEEIVVTARQGDIIDGNRTGAETFVSLEKINSTPTVNRSIGDFARYTPQATIEEGNDGLSISIGGQNNRYNAIYIDGAVNNDVFGLAGSGTNGGQTGVSPISLDAIGQFQVSVAPMDVRQSGFAGGSINAVTRSGTNEVEGSVYYLWRNEQLAGIDPAEDEQIDDPNFERSRLPEFNSRTYGVRLGGPLVKDKLFYFVSLEQERNETPQPFNIANYNGNAGVEQINQLVSFLQSEYGYDPGPWDDNTAFLNSDKLLAKIDWNINPSNKLTLRHSFTGAENLEARNSSSSGIRFRNGSEYFISNTNSTALELKTNISNSMFNHLTVGATLVRDDRDPFGEEFPAVFIDDGRGGFTFGAETFSTANLLDQDVITINNNLELYKGRHTLLFGVNLEFYRAKNLFIPFNFGDYEWARSEPIGTSNLSDFLAGEPSDFFIRSYSLRDNITGDESVAGVEFSGAQYGFYVQDEFQINPKLKMTLGLRGDLATFSDTPANPDFNSNAVQAIENAGYDLQGARTGDFIEPQLYISPRFGFNYDIFGDQTAQLRGGAGIFTSRIPLVWPGGAYNNNGLNRGTVLRFGDLVFNPNINQQPPGEIDPNNPEPSGDIDLFTEDFKIPQVAKFNLAYDQKLPWGMVGTLEGIFNSTINQVYYQNVNLRPAVGRLEGTPDDRPIFDQDDPIDDTYGRIILGSNTSKGYSYNVSAQLVKPFQNGFSGSLAYSYGDAFSIYDGTSSQNSSQWRGLHAITGRNTWEELARSNFAQGSRVIGQISYAADYFSFGSSQISLVYEGRSGELTTYIYGSGDDLTNEDSRNRALMYVPRNQSEIVLVDQTDGDGNVTFSAADQWAALDAFISNDDYLDSRRGQYTERNASRAPFISTFDFRFLQDFYFEQANGKRHTLQLSFDIFNFGNLLNSTWGRRYFGSSDGIEILEFEGFQGDTNVPTFSFQEFDNNDQFFGRLENTGVISARWQMQIGVRYIFGN